MAIDSNVSKLKSIINEVNVNNNMQGTHWLESMKFKILFYKVFRVYLYIYWTMEGIVLSVRPIFEEHHEWIFALIHQVLLLANMIFLYFLLNFASAKLFKQIENREIPQMQDLEMRIPLPFDKSKNAEIVGKIVIIDSVWNSKNYYKAIGVETFFRYHRRKLHFGMKFMHNQRSLAYKMNDSGESLEDVKKITAQHKQEEGKIGEFDSNQIHNGANNQNEVCEGRAIKSISEDKQSCSDESKDDTQYEMLKANQSSLNSDAIKPNNEKLTMACPYIFGGKRIIDFTTQENINSFLELEAKGPLNAISKESRERGDSLSNNFIPIELEMIQIDLTEDI